MGLSGGSQGADRDGRAEVSHECLFLDRATSDFLSSRERVTGYTLDSPSEFRSDPTALIKAFSIVPPSCP